MSDSIFEGPDGHVIETQVIRNSGTPFHVIYTFLGEVNGNDTVYIRRVQFTVWPDIQIDMPAELRICERETDTLFLTPRGLTGGNGVYSYTWTVPGQTDDTLFLYPPHVPNTIGLVVTDEAGCMATDIIQVKIRPCLGITPDPKDENNDKPEEEDPPPPDGNITFPVPYPFQRTETQHGNIQPEPFELHVYPVPTHAGVRLKWSNILYENAVIEIYDLQGVRIDRISIAPGSRNMMQLDTETLLPGVYLIHLSTGKYTTTKKMIVIE
jgi:hypothetical protein